MNKLTYLFLLETLTAILLGVILYLAEMKPFYAFSTCMVLGVLMWINYEVGKEVKR